MVEYNLGTLVLPEEIAEKKMTALKEMIPMLEDDSGTITENEQEYLRRIIKEHLDTNMTRGQNAIKQKELQNAPPEPSIDII